MFVKDRMDRLINEYPVFMVSKSYCPYCRMAKQALNKYNINKDKIKILEIDRDSDQNRIQDYMMRLTGARSVILEL